MKPRLLALAFVMASCTSVVAESGSQSLPEYLRFDPRISLEEAVPDQPSPQPSKQLPEESAEPVMPPSNRPVEAAGELLRLQDAITGGAVEARADFGKTIVSLSAEFASLPEDTWTAKSNQDAAILLVLLGGNPELSSLIEGHLEDHKERKQLLAFLKAFDQNDFDLARDISEAMEKEGALNSLPQILAAQFSVFKAVLYAQSEPERARQALFKAVSMAPGTIFEEAALRQLVPIAALDDNVELFDFCVRSYLNRFPSSPYFSDFVRVLMETVKGEMSGELAGKLELGADQTQQLSAENRLMLLGAIARAAVFSGKLPLAKHASAAALTANDLDPKLEARLRLYQIAAQLDEIEDVVTLTAMLEPSGEIVFDESDRALMKAVKTLQMNINNDFAADGAGDMASEQKSPRPGENAALQLSAEASVTQTLDKAKSAIKSAQQAVDSAAGW